MVWTKIRLPDGSTHWMDEQGASTALSRSEFATEGRNDPLSRLYLLGRGNAEAQVLAVRDAWESLGGLYVKLNILPNTDVGYVSGFVDAYGLNLASFVKASLDAPGFVSSTNPASSWMAKKSVEVIGNYYGNISSLQRSHITSVLSSKTDYVVRAWLLPSGKHKVNCQGFPGGYNCFKPYGGSYGSSTSAAGNSSDCQSRYSWECVSWIGTETIFPALVWSLDLAAQIVASIKARGLQMTIQHAVTFARSNGLPPQMAGTDTMAPDGSMGQLPQRPVTVPNLITGARGERPGPSARTTTVDDTEPTPEEPGGPIRSPRAPGTTGTQPTTAAPDPSSGSSPPTTGSSTAPPSKRKGTAPSTPSAMLTELGLECAGWLALSEQRKNELVKTSIVDAWGLNSSASEIDGIVSSVSQSCVAATPSAPGGPPPSIPIAAQLLVDFGTSCKEWMTFDAAQKAAKITPQIINARGIPIGSQASIIAALDQYCVAPAHTKVDPIPATPEGLLVELGLTCEQWSSIYDLYHTQKKALLVDRVFNPRLLAPTDQVLSAMVMSLDMRCAPPTQAGVGASGSGSWGWLLAGAAAVGGLAWSNARKKQGK